VPVDEDVEVSSRGFELPGHLTVPAGGRGLVVFPCDGTDGPAPYDRDVVARTVRGFGFGTLLMDLCSPEEVAADAVDVDVLAVRLLVATRWLRQHVRAPERTIAYFGALRCAAIALLAAAEDPSIGAVATRSAQLDGAVGVLSTVQAPTLFLVGGDDPQTRAQSEGAASAMHCTHRVEIVPGAGERFEAPGALEASARLAGRWFVQHLGARTTRTRGDEFA
jgi:putative phosphoribosyl transferase